MNIKIEQAAVRWDGKVFSLPPPARHDSVFKSLITDHGYIEGAVEMGFTTSEGNFVDRREAYEIAVGAGQVEDKGPRTLISEDLW